MVLSVLYLFKLGIISNKLLKVFTVSRELSLSDPNTVCTTGLLKSLSQVILLLKRCTADEDTESEGSAGRKCRTSPACLTSKAWVSTSAQDCPFYLHNRYPVSTLSWSDLNMKTNKTKTLHRLSESWYLTHTETSAWLVTGSVSERGVHGISYFAYGLASLTVMASHISTPRCLICCTAEGFVSVMASNEWNMHGLVSAISIHSCMQQFKFPEKEKKSKKGISAVTGFLLC